MIERKEYLDALKRWQNKHVIKVITGIRRCGKSTLMELFQQYLLNQGVISDRIISVNLEDFANYELRDPMKLHNYIIEKAAKSTEKVYVFIDEIQNVIGFPPMIDSLFLRKNLDLYITGSNAYMLSGELATHLSGRYVTIDMLPLSFAEFCQMKIDGDKDTLFAEYMKNGGLPYVTTLGNDSDKIDTYLEGIYNTIIVKDVEERQKRKELDPNKRKVTDIALLKNISKFLAGSIGSPISVKSIADYVTSSGRKTSQNTVDDYLQALVEPYIFYPVERYDVLGKQLLKKNQKMYIVDLGLRRHLLARQKYDLGFSLENIIYFELLRRGYSVNVGKVGVTEIDFVARKNDNVHYYQVTASMTEESTFEREMAPLKSITDNYPKTIITLDRFTLGNYEGIKVVNAVDWLLNK